ncbi:uncharacterized protein LOC18433104 [Amborella trichopoda]|uniref:AB hydrolase-1 domain-containing protein n=1 Tax=Amborella trichopoda TaxID=13333 RepID=W1PAH1_AMBTC|nr:uncharacterized protein LOC18433104 [Amborella trichopoda]ERN04938.1 hypothetical protein AMTR_s00080p00123550 [Amborella trichopoda]|eukprot:XP_006843263.1 uncharacterized protein LOC18433104 [Amborella trichopoda]
MAGSNRSWREELASLVEDTGIRLTTGDRAEAFGGGFEGDSTVERAGEEESLWEQAKGFLNASMEMMQELGSGCVDIMKQNVVKEDSFIVQKLGEPWAKATRKLGFLNEFLPEDRDPAHAWPIVLFVFFIALAVLTNSSQQNVSLPPPPIKVHIQVCHIRTANRFQLPDGRHIAYQEHGIPADKARYSLVAAHSFLSSRLAGGLPGIQTSLLEEFGVRLVTYDLPGFGESDPHPDRNLNSSALDMLYIADALGFSDKFWVMGYSGGGIHAWAALRYIPERLAGAALFAPFVNPYDSNLSKEEANKIWEKWTFGRKFRLFLARRFPSLLPYFYHRSFLSGKPGQVDKWLSLSLGEKDRALLEEPMFIDFLRGDMEESTRLGNPSPFVEEAVLQVSSWGFSLTDLQVQKKQMAKGFFAWLKSIYSQADWEWVGFLGPIHIWQGMDDRVVPPLMTEFARRVLPGATVHKLPGEGHFSYFCFCNECHRHIFSTLFGNPQGPLDRTKENESSSQDLLEDITGIGVNEATIN